jgi:predicted flavoprotein YhiN
MLAAQLDEHQFEVTVYEKNQASGRKFLVAGQGGFNLTHSDPLSEFASKYIPVGIFDSILAEFSNQHLIRWLESIGIPTFAGSSKRIFPKKDIKPIQVLNAILAFR